MGIQETRNYKYYTDFRICGLDPAITTRLVVSLSLAPLVRCSTVLQHAFYYISDPLARHQPTTGPVFSSVYHLPSALVISGP